MTDMLKDKVAVVTGSGQGIGKAIAILMAREGARVVTNNRRSDNPEGTAGDTAKEITEAGGTAAAVYADVATMEGGKKLIDGCLSAFGAIDILVNNAAKGSTQLFDETTEEQWDGVINGSLKCQFICARAAVPVMRARGYGRIINVSSRVGVVGLIGMASYAAAKAGVVGFTWSLARELGPYGITVNCMMPTATTNRTEESRRSRQAQTGVYHPPSSTNLPEHVAPIVVYLASGEAAGVNGQLFYSTGGEVSLYSVPKPIKSIYREGGWTLDSLAATFSSAFGTDLDPSPPVAPPA